MIVGIMSDTHGRVEALSKVLAHFESIAVEAIIHCGDVTRAECLEILSEARNVYMTMGNDDKGIFMMAQQAHMLGIHFCEPVTILPIGKGKTLAATHGNRPQILDELISSQAHAYVCHGHTHVRRDERIGQIRVINPGAMSHSRRGPEGVVMLDTDQDELTLINIKDL